MKRILIYTLMACVAFTGALFFRARSYDRRPVAATRPPVSAPDSVQLAAIGIRPGMQLVAYAFGSSVCAFCQKAETKKAFASLRQVLTSRYMTPGDYKSLSVVGVAINANVTDGLGYLQSVGPDAFNEISVGSGWQNENIVRLIDQRHVTRAGLPMVILVARSLKATLSPLAMTYGDDSVLTFVQGADAIAKWVGAGAPIVTARASLSVNQAQQPSRPPVAVVTSSTRR